MKLPTMPEIIRKIPGARGLGKTVGRATGVLPPKDRTGAGPAAILPGPSSLPASPPGQGASFQPIPSLRGIDGAGTSEDGEPETSKLRRQGLIYIPVRSHKLKGLARIWNQHRFSTGKGLYGVLHKPDDMLERAWLATRPLRDLDCDAKLYVLLDADVPGHAGETIVGGVEDPVAYSMQKKAGTREPRSANPLSPVLKLGNNCFVSNEHIWSPKAFARHMKEAGLPADFRFLRVYVGFSQYVKSKHEGACYDSHPGCAFVKEFASQMNNNGYKHLEVRGYFGMLSMGGDEMAKDYRYTKIYFENPRPTDTPAYFKPSEQSFVYYSNTDDVRQGTVLGRTTQAAEKAASFIRNPAEFIRKSIRNNAAKKLNPLA